MGGLTADDDSNLGCVNSGRDARNARDAPTDANASATAATATTSASDEWNGSPGGHGLPE